MNIIDGFQLHQALLNAYLNDGGTVLTGKKLLSFTQNPDFVTAHFESGEVIKTRLLIGADGIHSMSIDIYLLTSV